MIGHEVLCVICVKSRHTRRNFACGEENGFDMPCPDDRLCRTCRKAVKDATEQQVYLMRLYGSPDRRV